MESRSYSCLRCNNVVKYTRYLIKHVNVCKISITLLTRLPPNPASILEYNTTNYLDFLVYNSEENIH